MAAGILQPIDVDSDEDSDDSCPPLLDGDVDSDDSDDGPPPLLSAARPAANGSTQPRSGGAAVARTAVANGHAGNGRPASASFVQQVHVDDDDDDSGSEGPPSLGTGSTSDRSDVDSDEDSDDEPPGMAGSDEVRAVG